jgi:hypothetical protein
LFPFYYLPWSSEYVNNNLVDEHKYNALDRAGDYIIINATLNTANETVQIKVLQEQYFLSDYWLSFFFIVIVITVMSWIFALIRYEDYKIKGVFLTDLVKLLIVAKALSKILNIMTDICYLILNPHMN